MATFINYLLVYGKRTLSGGDFMWVITFYSNSNITMYEFDSEVEARAAFENMEGYRILSEIVYMNDQCRELVTV